MNAENKKTNSIWISISDIDESSSTFNHKTYLDINNEYKDYYNSSKDYPKTLLFEQDGTEAVEFYKAPDGRLGLGLSGDVPYFFDASGFPFDKQKLTMILSEFPRVDSSSIKVERVSLSSKLNTLWKIISTEIEIKNIPFRYNGDNEDEYKDKCLVYIHLNLARVPHYYVLNVLTPLMAVMIFCFCSVFIDQEDVANRLNVCGTSLLTFLAFLVITNDKLPKFNGFNKFMLFTTMNLFMISLIIIWSAISRSIKSTNTLDNIAFGILFVVFVITNSTFLIINYLIN